MSEIRRSKSGPRRRGLRWTFVVAALSSLVGCAETDESVSQNVERDDKSDEVSLEMDGEAAFPFERMLGNAREAEAERAIRECAGGSSEACYEVGDRYHGGDGVPRDNDLSVRIIEHACQSGYRRACYDLGARYYQGVEVEQDLPRARRYFQSTCEDGYPEACHMLARMTRDGLGGARDLGRARRLFERSCELGFDRDCDHGSAPIREAAVGEYEGRLPDDAPESVVASARECDSGLMSGCTRLGRAYESGSGVARDFERARRLYELACDWGQLEACRSFRMLQGSMHRFPGLERPVRVGPGATSGESRR